MLQGNFKWNGGTAKRLVFAAGWESIVRVTEFFLLATKKELSVSNPGVPHKITRGPNKGKTIRRYTSPSKPGEPPRARTGNLRANVRREYDKRALKSRVGLRPMAIYGLFLELAKEWRRRRPWLLATLNKYLPQLETLAGQVKEV